MSTKNNRTADAVKPGHENEHHSEEEIDILSEEFARIARSLIRIDSMRILVLADAFAKEHVRCHEGDVFDCLRTGEEIAGDRVSTHIVERNPSIYGNVDLDDQDDGSDDGSDGEDIGNDVQAEDDPFDEFCDSDFCDGCCDECPIAFACIPVFNLDGVELRVVLLGRDRNVRTV